MIHVKKISTVTFPFPIANGGDGERPGGDESHLS